MKAIALVVGICSVFAMQQPAAGERARAEVVCSETEQALKYSCTIQLSERSSGVPVIGPQIVIGADMPDMPMAHNVPPVIAVESRTPGKYHATLFLEMQGQWVLRLRISGPLQDIFIVALDFDQTSGHVHTPLQSETVDY